MRSLTMLALCLSTLATLATGCESGGPDPAPNEAPNTVAIAAEAAKPVVVANTVFSPVPTTAVGTTTVAGEVAASQRGAWSVTVANPVQVQGPVGAAQSGDWAVSVPGGIAATQAGPWTVDVGSPTVSLAAGATVAVGSLPPVALAGTPSVTIANTPSVILAGTPSVSVSGGVAITNTPAVTLTGTPSVAVPGGVTIANTDANPVVVRQLDAVATQTPWAATQNVPMIDGVLNSGVPMFAVPAGRRLVIERIEAQLDTPQGQLGLRVGIVTTVGGVQIEFNEALHHVATIGNAERFTTSTLTKLYADPGHTVGARLVRDQYTGVGSGFITLSGYLVDAP